MNKDNIKKLIKALKEGIYLGDSPVYFLMSRWLCVGQNLEEDFGGDVESWGDDGVFAASNCDTVACIAGHAYIVSGIRTLDNDVQDAVQDVAQDWLGLTDNQADRLFLPNRRDLRTREDAIKVLERLLETGEVEWEAIRYEDAY